MKQRWLAFNCSACAEYCTEVRESGPQCSMKFRHAVGRLTGSPVAPPGPGQYTVTTCDRPHSAAFTFGCSRPQSSPQTARCAYLTCKTAHDAALPCGMVSTSGQDRASLFRDCTAPWRHCMLHSLALRQTFTCLYRMKEAHDMGAGYCRECYHLFSKNQQAWVLTTILVKQWCARDAVLPSMVELRYLMYKGGSCILLSLAKLVKPPVQ